MNRLMENVRLHPAGTAQLLAAFPCRVNDYSQHEVFFISRTLIQAGHAAALKAVAAADGVTQRAVDSIDLAFRTVATSH